MKRWQWAVVFLVSLTATLGSLYFSEVKGFIPCMLCWYQRIFMYPLVIWSLVGLINSQKQGIWFGWFMVGIGWGISLYHVIIQFSNSNDSEICSGGVSCIIKYIEWFGFVTIPVLSLTAFTLLSGFLFYVLLSKRVSQKKEK